VTYYYITLVGCSVSGMADDDEQDGPDDETPELTEQRFAANLRAIRDERGISQGRLADEMTARGWPWHQQTVTRVENGRRMVRLGEAQAVAEILHTSLDRLTWPTAEARLVETLAGWTRTVRTAYRAIAKETHELLRARQSLRDAVAETDDASARQAFGRLVVDALAEARNVLQLSPEGAVAHGVALMATTSAFYASHGRDFPPFRPQSIDEAGEIADALRRGEIVVVDLTDTPKRDVQRIEDFVNGAARVRGGTVRRVSGARYKVMPATVDAREQAISTSTGTVTDPHPWPGEAVPDGPR
jgi:FtsZ-interacting cell division protein YlmF